MKKQNPIKILIAIGIALLLNQQLLFSQWQTNTTSGNNLPGTQNNILGPSNSVNNIPGKRDIRFFTFGAERMRLKGELGATQGFLGIGTASPASLLHVSDAEIRQQENAAINFYTGNTQRATISNSGSFGIGITSPAAWFHVVATDGGGEIFRTKSNASPSNYNAWRMYTGPGAGTEKFAIYTAPTASNTNPRDVIIQASQSGSTMRFNVGGPGLLGGTDPVTRMIITDGSFFGSVQTGLIGMGNNFLTPQSQLHLNDGGFATHLQVTNFATNGSANALMPAANDGFKIGITANGTAELRQQEALSMNFLTNSLFC